MDEPKDENERLGRIRAEALRKLGQTDYVVTQASERKFFLNPEWVAWRDSLRAVARGDGEAISQEPERFTTRQYISDEPAPLLEPEPDLPPEPPEHIRDLFVGDNRVLGTYEQVSTKLVRMFSDAKNKAELANSAHRDAERLYWEKAAWRFGQAIMWHQGKLVEEIR